MKRMTTEEKKAHILELLNDQGTTCKEALKANDSPDPWMKCGQLEWEIKYRQIIRDAQACIRWIEKQ